MLNIPSSVSLTFRISVYWDFSVYIYTQFNGFFYVLCLSKSGIAGASGWVWLALLSTLWYLFLLLVVTSKHDTRGCSQSYCMLLGHVCWVFLGVLLSFLRETGELHLWQRCCGGKGWGNGGRRFFGWKVMYEQNKWKIEKKILPN